MLKQWLEVTGLEVDLWAYKNYFKRSLDLSTPLSLSLYFGSRSAEIIRAEMVQIGETGRFEFSGPHFELDFAPRGQVELIARNADTHEQKFSARGEFSADFLTKDYEKELDVRLGSIVFGKIMLKKADSAGKVVYRPHEEQSATANNSLSEQVSIEV